MGYSPRYEVGYSRPVKGAFGDGPREFHCSAQTDELETAKEHKKMLIEMGHRAFIFDTQEGCVVPEGE